MAGLCKFGMSVCFQCPREGSGLFRFGRCGDAKKALECFQSLDVFNLL